MIVGIVGVLYSGAAYMPLDTKLPDKELRMYVEVAQPVAAVVTSKMWDASTRVFGTSLPCECVSLRDGDAGEPEGAWPVAGLPGHAAYALFTSGSTGTPKCVVQRHETVLHLFSADRSLYGYCADDVYLLVNQITFDISVSDMFNALTTGGELLVASDDELSDDAPHEQRALTRWLQTGAFSVTSMTPSAFRRTLMPALVGSDEGSGAALRLRLISFSGEGLQRNDLVPVMRRHPSLALVNKYGLTEVQDVTYLRYSLAADTPSGCVGGALPGSSLYVLKPPSLPPTAPELAEPGHVGEIAVGGPQVANGYLGAAALTAERFVADPFAPDGGRLFRTGDAGRWAEDGSLVCLGRMADMLRIRGELVDVSSAEATLRAAAAASVKDVALVACPHAPGGGDKQLVAFYVLRY